LFETDRLLYIDLHKTGCSHIRRVLDETVGGRRIGKHNRPDAWPSDRVIVGSIRNPWDWYVSLWAFGCKGSGAVFGRTTRRFTPWYYGNGLLSEMYVPGWRPGPVARTLWHDLSKPVGAWRDAYRDPEDADRFRRWLRLVFSYDRRFDLGEGYGFSGLSAYAGLLTYRDGKLFFDDVSPLFGRACPAGPAELRRFDREHNVLQAVVRTESLEVDLVAALETAGYEVPEDVRARILGGAGGKTNTSKHRAPSEYYDDETTELVRKREQLIVEKYGYTGPTGGTKPRDAARDATRART